MNIRFLETFIWVARLRSFSAAAGRMNATQAAVSNRIATLERDLGTRLFDRDFRDVRLTRSGRLLLERAVDIVRLTSEFRGSIDAPQERQRVLSIGAVDIIACAWLPILMARLRAEYPDILIALSVETSCGLARQVACGELDLGFVLGPLHHTDLVTLDLGAFPCRWVGAPNLAPNGPASLKHLATMPILTHCKGSPSSLSLLDLLDRHAIDRGPVRIYNANSVATIMALVRDGVGTACLPELLVREAVARGEIRGLMVEEVVSPIRTCAVYSSRIGAGAAALVADLAACVARRFFAQEAGTETDMMAAIPALADLGGSHHGGSHAVASSA